MIEINSDHALTPWDGVFFELARDHDFRAVGQEPGWRLDIHKGKEIHFTNAYGEREAVTPVPVPEIDPDNGATVYHAVTEANDLHVVIETDPCTDAMSGKPFQTTVTVTLNGRTYQGCDPCFCGKGDPAKAVHVLTEALGTGEVRLQSVAPG